jgi:putative flippase GtrA
MKRFILFLGVGGSSTLLHFALLALFVELFWMNEVIASFLGYLLSSGFNYWGNYRFTFNSQKPHRETLPKFIAAVLFGLSLNTAAFITFLYIFKNILIVDAFTPYLIAQFIATGITVLANFVLHKIWIYRNNN